MAEHSPAVTFRLQQDATRSHLRALDMQDGGSRLYEWTVSTQQNEIAEMARKKAQPSKAAELLAALNFVSVAGTRDDADYKEHVVLNNGFAVACDGQITAGYPIAEDLECCPHLAQIKAMLARTGNSLNITELENGMLSIKGDKLTAKIPCIGFDKLPTPIMIKPDANIAAIDDRLKTSFATCGLMISENGTRPVECGLLLEANVCTGCDGKILIQHWHGIDLPPKLFVPKIFAAAVAKSKLGLTGFGFTPDRSITFYFENGAWLKTLLYADEYPNVSGFIDRPSSPVPVPDGLFEGIDAVAAFDPGAVASLTGGRVKVANAEYEVAGLDATCGYGTSLLKVIASIAKTIDLVTYDDRAFFFGDDVRGLVMGIKQPKERELDIKNFEIGRDPPIYLDDSDDISF